MLRFTRMPVDPNGPPWGVKTVRADWRNLETFRGQLREPRGIFASVAHLLGRPFMRRIKRSPAPRDDDPPAPREASDSAR